MVESPCFDELLVDMKKSIHSQRRFVILPFLVLVIFACNFPTSTIPPATPAPSLLPTPAPVIPSVSPTPYQPHPHQYPNRPAPSPPRLTSLLLSLLLAPFHACRGYAPDCGYLVVLNRSRSGARSSGCT
jgi:hypothetical protein